MADVLLQRRADAVTTAPQGSLDMDPVPMTGAAADDFAADLAVLRHNARVLKPVYEYSGAEVTVIPGESTVSGDTATLKVTEQTNLYSPKTEGMDPEGYSLPHTITFTRSAQGEWELAEDKAEVDRSGVLPSTQIEGRIDEPVPVVPSASSDDPGPINEPGPADEPGPAPEPEPLMGPVDEAPASTAKPTPEAMSVADKSMTTASYNYQYMVNYARKHAKSYNKLYRSYDNDCTNFISQALRQGGWGMTGSGVLDRKDASKWFYGNYTWTTSYTWAGAHNWYWFASHYSRRTKLLDNVWKMSPSDVLQIDFVNRTTGRPDGNINHTMMVTKKLNGELYLSGHTNDVLDKPLTVILFENKGAWFYAHRT